MSQMTLFSYGRGFNSQLSDHLHPLSVVGPLLFVIFILPFGLITCQNGLSFHCYVSGPEFYSQTQPRLWYHLILSEAELKLNQDKSEAILVALQSHFTKYPI